MHQFRVRTERLRPSVVAIERVLLSHDRETVSMKIRAGFHIAYECQNETPMLLVLKIHPSRERDLCSEQTLEFDRIISQRDYLDAFGNACTRIVAPSGTTTISARFEVSDSGVPELLPGQAVQLPIQDLPDDVLVFLLGSRYCDTDRLADFAWKQFSATPLGWPRVKAILDFVHGHLAFDYDKADPTRTAYGGFMDRTGVCRDFAHLTITLCRCLNIPARYCTGYLGDIGVPKDAHPWISVPGARPISAVAGGPSMRATMSRVSGAS